MNKATLVEAILEKLHEEFASFQKASKQTRSAGNDEQSKSEGKYDTRSTEENYLADGLAKQAAVTAQAAAAYEGFDARDFAKDESIDLGALVQIQFPGETEWFFLGPGGGGIEVTWEKRTVTVITPEAPLGAQLIGKRVGETTDAPKAKIVAVR